MNKLDKVAKDLLNDIYTQFNDKKEITVSSSNYKKTTIDYLIDIGLLEKRDVSTLNGWAYIISPTHVGEVAFADIMDSPSAKVDTFIKQGEVIMKEEFHHVSEPGIAMPDYISGSKSNQWFNEISIFNERFLLTHPLHDKIATLCENHNHLFSPHKDMIDYLKTLALDEEYWAENELKGVEKTMQKRKSIEQLLAEDIERCEQYLKKPNDLAFGRSLYTEITSRYDSIINGFGNGLYQYYAEQHFYDPEIGAESLTHNLTSLLNKMISFQAMRYPVIDTKSHDQVIKYNGGNKIFIVHGHDNLAVQEMARTLAKCEFEPIILHEQPDAGLTIIEKIERYTDVCYAVVLYTEDDLGHEKNTEASEERNRARQNVVFEHGYLIGKLGRNRVTALVKGNIETPGDISGVVYVPMDNGGAWKMHLAKNMQDINLPVDMNKFCR